MSRVKAFVFRGMLASNAITELRTAGDLRTPAHSPQERQDDDMLVSVPAAVRTASVEMQRAYRLLFVFENLVRNFVDQRFTEVDKRPDWWETRATADMKKKFADRKKEEEKNAWHPGRSDAPLFYVDFGDLALLIINHWSVFKDFFPNQAWISSRIQETERSRNVIAHTNRLPEIEAARLEQTLRDWIAQVA
jgi:HEPN superfamily Swt1-like protein